MVRGCVFFFQAEDGIRDYKVTGVQTCALPILPPGSSLARTDEVQQRVVDICLKTPGVAHAVSIVGFSGATFTNAPNSGAVFLILDDWADRGRETKLSAAGITGELLNRLSGIQEGL